MDGNFGREEKLEEKGIRENEGSAKGKTSEEGKKKEK
jgi:hypothetical protein